MSKAATLTKITQISFYFNALLWVVVAANSLMRSRTSLPFILIFLMLGNAGAMLGCGIFLPRKEHIFHSLALLIIIRPRRDE